MPIDWSHFTPLTALAGGVLIGIAAAMFVLLNGVISVFVHFVALGSRFLNKINRLRQSHFPRPRCFSCSLWRCVGVATHDAPRDPARRHSLAD